MIHDSFLFKFYTGPDVEQYVQFMGAAGPMLAVAGLGVAAASAYSYYNRPVPTLPPFDLDHQTIIEVRDHSNKKKKKRRFRQNKNKANVSLLPPPPPRDCERLPNNSAGGRGGLKQRQRHSCCSPFLNPCPEM